METKKNGTKGFEKSWHLHPGNLMFMKSGLR
jgi:hypothetical protein